MSYRKEVNLTPGQIDALLWAITITRDSFAGWDEAELAFHDVNRDLAKLGRAEQALLEKAAR